MTTKRRNQRVFNSLNLIRHVAYKAADTSRASTVVLADDADLQFKVAAGEKWAFKAVLFVDQGASDVDFKMAIVSPGTAVLTKYEILSSPAAAADAAVSQRVDVQTAITVNLTVSEKTTITIQGFIAGDLVNGAGVVKLQWCQGTSNAAAVVLEAGSYLVADKLA